MKKTFSPAKPEELGDQPCAWCGHPFSAHFDRVGCACPDDEDADPVNAPSHYTAHPSGVECITITEHLSFCVGNAIKYLWRADLKGNALEDLKKARYYVDREIKRRGGE